MTKIESQEEINNLKTLLEEQKIRASIFKIAFLAHSNLEWLDFELDHFYNMINTNKITASIKIELKSIAIESLNEKYFDNKFYWLCKNHHKEDIQKLANQHFYNILDIPY